MSEYRKLVEEFFERYENPVVEEFTVGFSGIDPPLKTPPGIINHEELQNLLGGTENEHYHLTKEQIDWLIEAMSEKYPPVIFSGQTINSTANEEITPYEMQGENVR